MKVFNIYIPIYGIIFSGKYMLGKFELLDRSAFLAEIEDRKVRDKVACAEEDNYFLALKVKADDKESAYTIAEKEAIDFKRLMDFCCGRNNCVPAVNLTKHVPNSIKFFLLDNPNKSVGVHETSNNNYIPINHTIDAYLEEMEKNKTKYVWDLYSKEERTDKENRIINAILWIGKAHVELDNKIYFIELCFALESLLQVEVDKFINPSITYSIATNCAIIIADCYKTRETIVKTIKDLYVIRSKIAHGKNVKVENDECEILYRYLAYLLEDLTCDPKWVTFETMKNLLQEVEKIKLGKNKK